MNFGRSRRAVAVNGETRSVRAGGGARGSSPPGPARVTVDRPVVQRAHPRGFVGERCEAFCVVESEYLVLGTVVTQARAKTNLNGGIDLMDLLVSLIGGVDAEFSFGFSFVDELLSEVHD